jgi:post-segregation antitoxin (ccd killing protein)
MSTACDTRASKRPVNLTLNAELVEQARQLTGNLSAEVETLLAGFVQQKMAEHDAQRERLHRSAASWNAFNTSHGSFSDEFSTL